MAFENKRLSVIAYANGFTMWQYSSTTDAIATITGTNYFAIVKSIMKNGDIVICNGIDGVTIKAFRNGSAVALS